MKKSKKLCGLMLALCLALLQGSVLSVRAQEESVSYVIRVNRAANCVTVYTADEQGNETAVRAMACSCGREGHATPLGTYTTSDYFDWCYMVDSTYGRYAIRFNRGIMFHSVPYLKKSPDTLEWDQYNLLGESASLGCVRLCLADVKWLYDNCPEGTKVVVYDDEENPGPLGKPETFNISEESPYKGWDPTDTDVRSPWNTALMDAETYDSFDAEGYAKRYPDVKAAFGVDKDLLWKHYIQYGRQEGRTSFDLPEGQSFKNFDAEAYADRYPDVKKVFGTDKRLLWRHYIKYGRHEGRIAF